MKKILLACGLLLIVSACAVTTNHSTPIRPESLVNATAEKISFPISDSASVITIEDWIIAGDAPTSVEISCADGNPSCVSLKTFLTNHHIAYQDSAAGESSSVSLTYNRLIARTCNPNSFGCSTSLNSISMVTNRDQFIKPALSDFPDAASAVKAVRKVK